MKKEKGSEFYRDMGERLRKFREKEHYSQEDMAKKLGYKTVRYYGEVERGLAKLTADRMLLLYENTGMDLTYLVTGESTVVYDLDVVLKKCGEDKLEQLRSLIEAAIKLAEK